MALTFQSDTDTEVVAQLLEFHYNECHNMLEAVGRVLRRIEGSYAFGIICADYPNALIAARKDSPLIIGCGEGRELHCLGRDGHHQPTPGMSSIWRTGRSPF